MRDSNMEASCFHGQPLIALQLGLGEALGEERTRLLLPWHPRSTVVHDPAYKYHVSLVSASCTREDRHFPLFPPILLLLWREKKASPSLFLLQSVLAGQTCV